MLTILRRGFVTTKSKHKYPVLPPNLVLCQAIVSNMF